MDSSPHSAGGPGLSGTTADLKARPASAASDSKDTGSEKDEAAAAAATTAEEQAGVLPLPAHKERQSLAGGEDNVAGNLGAQAANGVDASAAARAEDVKRIFAGGGHGEGKHSWRDEGRIRLRLARAGQHRQGRDPGEQHRPRLDHALSPRSPAAVRQA